jgi:Protein of unknown function (DUF3048) N-terminal domain
MVMTGWDWVGSDASHYGGNVGAPPVRPAGRPGNPRTETVMWNCREAVIASLAVTLAMALTAGLVLTSDAEPAAKPIASSELRRRSRASRCQSWAVLGVKIDNIAQARSQTGLSKADIVCVLPVEGGLTRLLAIFSSERPNAVGPVRSAREADLELLAQFGEVLHDGKAFQARGSRPSADGGTTFTTASGQLMTFAAGPVWVVLAAR